ncbi:MAG: cell wall-binding repeat-containing protein [Acidimicrobiia bacterium]|nr:MAG: cell wall-binding repeat-containing protein [Acidimicrobiia bacterium]
MLRAHRSIPLSWLLAVVLIGGLTFRIGAAVADSPDPQAADVVYIATGTNFPDALGAGPAAALGNGPILLVQTDAVPSQTTTELNRLKPHLIVIVGGTAVVSTSVENTLKGLGFGPTVIRVSGSNRYATAAAISESAFPCDAGMVMAGTDRHGPVCRAALSGNWSTQTVDSTGSVGTYTSLALDAFGNPVVSYYDVIDGNLKVAHCDDPACSGGGESVRTVASTGDVGRFTSLALDASGFPVISYLDYTNGDLKLAHCNDPNCDGVGESIVSVDLGGYVGEYTSLVLDASGFPVIAYYDSSNENLKLVHCNDVNCAGGDETPQTVDTAGASGYFISLVLDASGFPVISYHDLDAATLKVAHCNDANCAPGGESIQTVDSSSAVGWYTSLALDRSGYPVISYYDISNTALKVAHCNDANCAPGGESIETVDSAGDVGAFSSLVLDAAGNPMVAYYYSSGSDLRLVSCNDPNCAGADEKQISPDSAGSVGAHLSMVLDRAGNPVISYYDGTNARLKVASF